MLPQTPIEHLRPGRPRGSSPGTTALSVREAQVHAMRETGKTWNQIAEVIPLDTATLRGYYRRALRKIERRAAP